MSVVTQLESGGAQTVAVELHREFLRRGIASELVFLYEKDGTVFPQRDYLTMLDRAPRSPVDLARVVSRLRAAWTAFGPTTILAHTHFTNNICAMVRASGASGDVLAIHHNLFESYPAASRVLDRIGRTMGLYAGEISVAQPVQRSLPAASARSHRDVILNGQSLSRSDMDMGSARRSFGLPEEAFLIGNIGRLSEQKNQAFLIEMLAALPDVHVAILGEGQLRQALTGQAAALGVGDRLHLIGAVVHERVPDFLAALDIFAMPSLWEGMSIAMLEALAIGVPFIGNDIPPIAEVTDGGAGGAGLVLPLEVARWAAEINRLRADPAATAALATRERARADDFSIARMADRYLAFAQGTRR